MNLNVGLNKEDMEKLSCMVADKVLETTRCLNTYSEYYKGENHDLKHTINVLNSEIVDRDIRINRLRDRVMKYRNYKQLLEENNFYNVISKDEEFDNFIIQIKKDIDRPNDMNDEEIVKEYMNNNYYNKKYEIVDLNTIEKIEL